MWKNFINMYNWILEYLTLPFFSLQYFIRPLVKYGLVFYIILFTCYLFYYIYVLSKSVINYNRLLAKSKKLSIMGLFEVPDFVYYIYYGILAFLALICISFLIPIICIVFIPIYPILSMDWKSVGINDSKFLIALFVFILLTALSIYLFFFNS